GVSVEERPVVSADNEINQTSAFVEPVAGGRNYGTWLVSVALGAPQSFTHEGRTYTLAMRLRRQYLPYAFTLKQFRHDVYPGTEIPKNFSSLVQVVNPSRNESREVLIYMNQPLRYEGKTFYQASFGKNDTLSILSVVENPGWLLPYVSCVLVSLGLLVHFAIVLRRSLKRRQDKKEG
ncbi:MAG: cytochrome c biogenesis protein ResB, partial [Geothrix sp.]|nr:cytochrome c biogenesis protein ResB [Geothrix sp.]